MKQHTNPVKAIHEFCLSCSGDSYLSCKECSAPDCALYAFRLGKNPYRVQRELSEADLKHLEEMRQRRKAKYGNGNDQDQILQSNDHED